MNTPYNAHPDVHEEARRLAAAAPQKRAEDEATEDLIDDNAAVDELFEQWSAWCRTRRYFAPPSSMGNIIGKLRGSTRPSRLPPDAACSATMAALHLAIIGQPREALDTKVFWLYYGERINHIKQAADALGISRQHFYRLRNSFTARVIAIAKQLEAENVAAGDALPHRYGK